MARFLDELRHGNWIVYLGEEIAIRDVEMIELCSGVGNPKPIPLTKERILELGFKAQFGSTTLGLTASYGAHLEWDETEKVVVLLDCDDGVIGEPCRFIHEVQNLYYSLERKELQLKR